MVVFTARGVAPVYERRVGAETSPMDRLHREGKPQAASTDTFTGKEKPRRPRKGRLENRGRKHLQGSQ
jgi:hypothetical protein